MSYDIKSFLLTSLFFLFVFSASAQEKTPKVVTEEFEVQGVCIMCKLRIENAALIKGVKLAEWDQETGVLKVIYKPKQTTLEEIQKAVAEHGHDTKTVKASDKSYSNLPACCAYRDGIEKH
ncbi:MAG: hypothetical protein AAFP02_19225 [Bacteroidota bacterium]